VVTTDMFDLTVIIFIMLNALVLCLSYEGMSAEYAAILVHVNNGFAILFALEAVAKITAMNIKQYVERVDEKRHDKGRGGEKGEGNVVNVHTPTPVCVTAIWAVVCGVRVRFACVRWCFVLHTNSGVNHLLPTGT